MTLTKKIKVLQVLEATVGGTRRHLISLLQSLDRNQFEAEVAAPYVRHGNVNDDTFAREVISLGVPLHIIDMRREIHPWFDLKALINLSKLMRHGNYDLIHLHSSKAGFLGRLAAKTIGLPTVYTPNGFYFLQADNPTKSKLYLQLERWAGRFTNYLIAVSQSESDAALRYGIVPTSKLKVIPNTIDHQQFRPNSVIRDKMRQAMNIPASAKVVGIISRYTQQKDPLTIIQTAKYIIDTCPNVHFVWCGEGEMQEQTLAMAKKLKVEQSFHFLGFRKDVQDVMQIFDIFLLASIFEGLPYTLLETMSMGIPVVATDVVGTRDIVEHEVTGLLAPARQPSKIAEFVVDLLNDEKLRLELGQNAQQTVYANYDVIQMVKNIEKLYRSLTS